MKRLRILLVDDDPLLLSLVGENLDSQPDLKVVAAASGGRQALEMLEELHDSIDVLLLDVAMPEMSGSECASRVRALYSSLTIVMFTSFEQESMLRESLLAGASGFLTKDLPTEELALVLHRANAGEIVLGPRPMSLVTESYLGDQNLDSDDRRFELAFRSLPERLSEVVIEIGRARTNQQIACSLGLTLGTTRGYVNEVLHRTGCRSRTEVAVRAVRLGLLA